MNRILIVAYHFPPCAVSSGIQRTLSFAKHLPSYGWLPVVLSAHPSAYERTSPAQLESIPPEVAVSRTFALDAARHLSIKGRYPSSFAVPDRWRSWWLSAVPTGLRLIKRHSIQAIWSTYPIATAHNIGATLARLSGLPWIADFRDPMVEHIESTGEWFPRNEQLRAARLAVEARATQRASKLVFCTRSAQDIVAQRYPHLRADQLAVISNGYDEDAFKTAVTLASPAMPAGKLVLVHSGTIYLGTDRDPTALLKSVRTLMDRGLLNESNFELRLRDPSSVPSLQRMIDELGVGKLARILPSIPYFEALGEMKAAGGLIVLQGHTSNPAIPAKLYEYLRAGRPILGLVDPEGETAATLRAVGITSTANITDEVAITALLEARMRNDLTGFTAKSAADVTRYSRQNLTGRLAEVLNEVVAEKR